MASSSKKKVDIPDESPQEATQGGSERNQKYTDYLALLKKKYGEDVVQKITVESVKGCVQEGVRSTGILPVDRATRIGGLPRGRIIEIMGPESSGKTTICLHATAEVMKLGHTQLYIDAEHALEKSHVIGCGADGLEFVQPDCGEEALDIAERAAEAGIDLVVIDSVAALVPRAEIDGNMGDSHMGLQARLMSQALRKLTGKVAKSGTTMVFINQIRHKIGVMFGSPETTTGGNALKFYSSLRLDVRKKNKIERNGTTIGNEVQVTVKKSKVGVPYESEIFDMYFVPGETIVANAIKLGSDIGIITKAGTWYSYGDVKLGQGLPTATNVLINEKPELVNEILEKCRKNLFNPVSKVEDVV